MADALAVDLRLALDPVAFARALNIEPDSWQQEVLRSPSKRTLLNCSRQAGKSTVASVRALHLAYYRPMSLALLISPSLRQSAELFRKIAQLVELLPTKAVLREDKSCRCVWRTAPASSPCPRARPRFEASPARISSSRTNPAACQTTSTAPCGPCSLPRLAHCCSCRHLSGSAVTSSRSGSGAATNGNGFASLPLHVLASLRASWPRSGPASASGGFAKNTCASSSTVDQVFAYDLGARAVTSEVKPLFGPAPVQPKLPAAIQPLFPRTP